MIKATPSVIHTVPYNMNSDTFDKTVFEICDIFKTKGLTIKQALSILDCCEDMLLETVANV